MNKPSKKSTLAQKRSRVLFIVSMGHSGSTLLDLLCGTLPGVFSMGEVDFFSWQLKQGEIKEDPQTYCSCGAYFDKCEFWAPILKEISETNKVDIFKQPEKVNFSINRGIIRGRNYLSHNIANKLFKLSYYHGVFRPFRYLVFKFYQKSIKNTWNLYDLAAKKSNCEFVVDSSKNINRALLLKMFRPSDLKILLLKRDVKGVATSSHHGLNDTMIKERTIKWIDYYYKKMPAYFSCIPKEDYMQVTYEKMCSDYNSLRIDIADFLDFESHNIKPIKCIAPYQYHTVQGNPMRLLKKDIEIRYDERWRDRLNKEQLDWINEQVVGLD